MLIWGDKCSAWRYPVFLGSKLVSQPFKEAGTVANFLRFSQITQYLYTYQRPVANRTMKTVQYSALTNRIDAYLFCCFLTCQVVDPIQKFEFSCPFFHRTACKPKTHQLPYVALSGLFGASKIQDHSILEVKKMGVGDS